MTDELVATRERNACWGNWMIQFCGYVLIGSSVVKFLRPVGPVAYMASMGFEGGHLISRSCLGIVDRWLVSGSKYANAGPAAGFQVLWWRDRVTLSDSSVLGQRRSVRSIYGDSPLRRSSGPSDLSGGGVDRHVVGSSKPIRTPGSSGRQCGRARVPV